MSYKKLASLHLPFLECRWGKLINLGFSGSARVGSSVYQDVSMFANMIATIYLSLILE